MRKYNGPTLRFLPGLVLLISQMALMPVLAGDSVENPGQLSASDYKFAREAAMGGMMEVALGNLAAQNSSTQAIEEFGQQMVRDHGKAGQELQRIASSKGASLSASLPATKQKEVDQLAKMSGAAFDKAYVASMVKMHKADEKKFKNASDTLQDADLKAFAANTLLVVQGHLRMIENIADSMKHPAVNK